MSFGTTVTTTWDVGAESNPVMTILIAVVAVLLVGAVARGVYVWMRNNRAPQENVNARVVAKRMKVSGHGGTMLANRVSAMNTFHSSTYTNYFVTFELENGKRLELGVKDSEYGMLAEGDRGRLSWQGTRYLGFDRA